MVAGQSNDDFVERLVKEVDAPAVAIVPGSGAAAPPPGFRSLGFNESLNQLLEGADRVQAAASQWFTSATGAVGRWATSKKDEAGSWLSRQLVDRYRDSLHTKLSTFVGDVLVYINERGDATNPGAIPRVVLGDLESASAERTQADPLIVVGHSLGGVILYDLFSGFLPTRRPDLVIDVLVTVGSQVGLFEEIKQFRLRNDSVPGPGAARMPRPANVRRWVNIFDELDVLSFSAGKIFADVEDYDFSSETATLSAHSAYFLRSSFYHRLRERLFPPTA